MVFKDFGGLFDDQGDDELFSYEKMSTRDDGQHAAGKAEDEGDNNDRDDKEGEEEENDDEDSRGLEHDLGRDLVFLPDGGRFMWLNTSEKTIPTAS